MSNVESQYLGHNMEPGKNPSPIQCHRKSLKKLPLYLEWKCSNNLSIIWMCVCARASGTSKNWMIYIESLQLTYGGFQSTGVTPQLSFICLWIVHVFHHPLIGVPPNINIYGSMALHSLRGIAAMPDVLWPAEAAPNASCRRFRRCLSTVEMGQWWPAAGPSLEK